MTSLILGVLVFVSTIIFYIFINSYYYKSHNVEYQLRECMCAVLPTIILIAQVFPSIYILYFQGLSSVDPTLTVKVIGNQWYWNYDYCDIEGLSFDSYIKDLEDLELGDLRLLEVDNRCIVPCGINIRFAVTSSDVIHAWSLPSFGIKLDAISGVINCFDYLFSGVGVWYGQCSEVCGVNHRFIPIRLEVTTPSAFVSWVVGNMEHDLTPPEPELIEEGDIFPEDEENFIIIQN